MKGGDPQVEGGSTEKVPPDRAPATLDNPIQGGSTENVPPDRPRATPEHDPNPERFVIAKWLIFSLVLILILHYGLIFALEWHGKPSGTLESIFNAWLPVLSGLVSAAVTYYFAREQRR